MSDMATLPAGSRNGIAHVQDLDEKKATAILVDLEVRQLTEQVGRSWVRLGLACARVRDERLWQALGFPSFDAWIRERLEESRATVYATMRTLGQLSRLEPEQIGSMTKANAEALAKLPESRRFEPEMVEAAKRKPPAEFRAIVEEQLTPLERNEARRTVAFNVPASVAEVIERAVDAAKLAAETDSRAVAIEMVCAEFLSGHPE